jgi:hypothetical protein
MGAAQAIAMKKSAPQEKRMDALTTVFKLL